MKSASRGRPKRPRPTAPAEARASADWPSCRDTRVRRLGPFGSGAGDGGRTRDLLLGKDLKLCAVLVTSQHGQKPVHLYGGDRATPRVGWSCDQDHDGPGCRWERDLHHDYHGGLWQLVELAVDLDHQWVRLVADGPRGHLRSGGSCALLPPGHLGSPGLHRRGCDRPRGHRRALGSAVSSQARGLVSLVSAGVLVVMGSRRRGLEDRTGARLPIRRSPAWP